jgi:hypothetical protein
MASHPTAFDLHKAADDEIDAARAAVSAERVTAALKTGRPARKRDTARTATLLPQPVTG